MRLALESCGRLPRGLGLPALLVLVWGALVLLSAVVEQASGRPFETCLLLHATGRPCPTCGSTRALFALLRGHWAEAFLLNPLATAALPLLGAVVGLRVGLGRRLRVEASRRERSALLAAGLVLLLANWAWVLSR